jgi:tape measure domain-containing protein
MAIQPLSFKITADLSGFTGPLSQVTSQLRGVADHVRQSFASTTSATSSSMATTTSGIGAVVARLGGLAVAYAALRSIQTFAHIADDAALATARIQGLTGSTEQTRVAQAALFEMSQRLQSGYGEAVSSFSRMLPAVKELGGGVKETSALTEILLTTAKLSGASATEAANSAMQFAQALGSGTLQGDELRSILENNNTLARTLAAGLHVSIGELRKMGEEGKLTSDLVANTLLKSYDDIKSKAASLPQTVGGAWTQITNAFTLLVTSVSQGTGVFGALALVMGEVAKVVEVVAKTLFSAGDESDKLKQREGAKEFAEGVGKVFAFMADVVTATIRGVVDVVGALLGIFKAAGTQLGAVGAAMVAAMHGDFAGAAEIMRDAASKGAEAVTRLGTAIGESAARQALAWTGAGEAYQGYINKLAAGGESAAGGGGGGDLKGGGGKDKGDDSKERKRIADTLAAEMDAIDKSIAAERKRFDVVQQVSNARADMDRDRALAAIEGEQRVAKYQLDTQQITQAQYLQAEMQFEAQKYEIRRQAAERLLELAKADGRDPVEVERINQQLLALELDYQARKQAITLQVQQSAGGGDMSKAGTNVFKTMQNSMGQALDAMLTRSKSFGQAMAGVWANMRSAIIGEIGRMLMAKMAAFAKEKLMALAGITMSAAKAGAGAAESQASIPYVGPILAIAAMAAITAAVMGLGSGIKSAAGGYDIPAGLNPVTQLHAEEMVLPAEQANAIREMTRSGAGGGAPIELRGVSAGEFFIAVRKDLVAALKGANREFAF